MRRGLRCLGIAGLVMVIAGCWPASGQGPDRRAHNPFEQAITPATVSSLHVRWSAVTDEGFVGDPIVSNVAVHAADSLNLYGFDRSTGARLWIRSADPPAPPSEMGQPVADGGRLLVGFGFPNIGGHWTTEWLDAASGTTQSSPGNGLVDGLRGSTVLLRGYGFGSQVPVLVGVSMEVKDLNQPGSGWSGPLSVYSAGPLPPPMTLGITQVYQGGRGVVAEPGMPVALERNGVRAYPVAQAPPLCGPSPGTQARCPTWSTPTDGTTGTSPVLGPGETTVYVGTDAGTLYALDAATGQVLWTAAVGAAVTDSPALADDLLYVPTADGDLVVLAAGGCGAATCSPLWQAPTGSPIQVQPAVAGGVVFTGSADGGVHAFDAAGCGASTCPSLWDGSTGSAITGAPAVSGGRLYVGTQDGRLVAYGLG